MISAVLSRASGVVFALSVAMAAGTGVGHGVSSHSGSGGNGAAEAFESAVEDSNHPADLESYYLEPSDNSGDYTPHDNLQLGGEKALGQVLVYFDDCGGTSNYAAPALANLGITNVVTVTNDTDFQTQMASDWDLVIVDVYGDFISQASMDALVDYYDSGGKIIYFYWRLLFDFAGHALFDRGGIDITAEYTTQLPVYVWSQSPLFDTPNSIPNMTSFSDVCDRDGQYLTVVSAQAVAGYTVSPSAGQAAVTISGTRRLIVNGFALQNFNQDQDSDTKTDAVELYENEIYYLLSCNAPPVATSPTPAHNAVDVSRLTDLSWVDGSSLYTENFDDGQAQGWVEIDNADWSVTGGEYVADSSSLNDSMQSLYMGQTWTDLSVRATLRRTGPSGPFHGVVFRASDDFQWGVSGTAYAVGTYGSGTFYVARYNPTWDPIVTATSPYLNTGTTPNEIIAGIEGSTIKVYFNGNLAWSGTDSTITGPGRVGLLGYSGTGPETIHYFDSVAVDVPVVAKSTISEAQAILNAASPLEGATGAYYQGEPVEKGRAEGRSGVSPSIPGEPGEWTPYEPLGEKAVTGELVFDGGSPTLIDGFEATNFLEADDFELEGTTTIQSVRFWTLERGTWDGSFAYAFHQDNAGVPGTVISSGTATLTRTATGRSIGDLIEYEIDFDVASSVILSAGTYWLSIHMSADCATRDEIYWAHGSGTFGAYRQAQLNCTGAWSNYSYTVQAAFKLYGTGACDQTYDVYLGTTPNPTTLLASDLAAPTCSAGSLVPGTRYYWRVVTKNCCGEVSGPVWSFVTAGNPPGVSYSTHNSTDTPKPLPDLSTTTSTITIGAGGIIADLNVALDITHTFDGDLAVWLTSPQGTVIELFSNIGGSGDNFTNTRLDDEAAAAITAGTPPFNGVYRLESASLSSFDGQNSTGTWTLTIQDTAGADVGTLNGWSLSFDYVGGLYGAYDIPKPITDNTISNSSMYIPEEIIITDINVTLDITHTWDADLDVFLQSPQGTVVRLFDDVGGSGDNFTNTTLDDEASTSIVAGIAPFSGSYQPEESLSGFDGQNAKGFWTLIVSDDAGADVGSLNSWSLSIPAGTIAGTPKWVRFGFGGVENGTQSNPYNLLSEGVSAVTTGGIVKINTGNTAEVPRITKQVRLEAVGGTARVGTP